MILITGGTGLLGQELIQHLFTKGVTNIIAPYRSTIPTGFEQQAKWIKGDILDVVFLEELMHDVTEVYHCAGYVSFSPKHRAELQLVNIDGTANIVNACLEAGVRKLVHVSSVAALGRHHKGKIITEKMEWTDESNNSEYGKTKFLGEMEVWRGIGEGLDAVIVNPTIIFGQYGDWAKGSMAIFKNIYNGFPWYSTGSAGFVSAGNVAEAMYQLMKSDISAQRFIISAENKTFQDLFFMIADAFGKKRPSKAVTPFLAAIVWRMEKVKSFFTKKDPMITKETADSALATVQFDNSALLKVLPSFAYAPLEISVTEICQQLKGKINNS